jgi:CRP-like cAMP-binding protein
VLRAIDIFGEMSIFDGRARSATVTAIVPTTLLVLSREDLENHLAAHPQTALQLLTEMAHRLRRADQAIAELALYDVSERLMRRLVGLAREDQLESPEGLVIRRRPTQQDLANMVGSCRETINRAYNTLVKKGLVFTRGRSLVVSMQLVQRLEPSTPQALRPSAVATRTLSIAPRVH